MSPKIWQPRNRRVLRFGDDLIDFFGVFRGVFGFSVFEFSPDDRIDNPLDPPPPDVAPPDDPLDSKNDFDFNFIGLLFVTCWSGWLSRAETWVRNRLSNIFFASSWLQWGTTCEPKLKFHQYLIRGGRHDVQMSRDYVEQDLERLVNLSVHLVLVDWPLVEKEFQNKPLFRLNVFLLQQHLLGSCEVEVLTKIVWGRKFTKILKFTLIAIL